jgi:hypothetical protein
MKTLTGVSLLPLVAFCLLIFLRTHGIATHQVPLAAS